MKRTIKSPAADIADLKQARLDNLNAPITCGDGNTFQFARDDKETIEGALIALESHAGLVLQWRQLDNTPVAVDYAILSAYLGEMTALRARRGVVVDSEYMAFRAQGCTRRQLHDWLKWYSTGFIPQIVF